MLLAAFHLAISSWSLVLMWFGTTTLSIAVSPGIFMAVLLAILLFRGYAAMKAHWQKSTGIGLVVVIVFWVAITAAAVVRQTYVEHVTMRGAIYGANGRVGLAGQVAYLKNQIDGPSGYRAKLDVAEAARTKAEEKYDLLVAARGPAAPPQRNPDGLYQYGELQAVGSSRIPSFFAVPGLVTIRAGFVEISA